MYHTWCRAFPKCYGQNLNNTSMFKNTQVTRLNFKIDTCTRGVKKMTKTLRTKSACAKRFRVMSSGHLKYWPRNNNGKSRVIRKNDLVGTFKLLKKLLTNSGWKNRVSCGMKAAYLQPDIDFCKKFRWTPLENRQSDKNSNAEKKL